jgi:hypothetical protein
MAQTFKIKRSNTTSAPTSLSAGELAYSSNSDKLFIGHPSTSAVTTIGGALYVDLFPSDIDGGTLEAGKILVADSNSKINKLLTGNIRINNTAGQIDTSSGNLTIAPASNLIINTGTVDFSGSATELKVIDNSATGLTIATAEHTYITIDSTNSAELVKFGKQVEFSGAYTLPTTDGTNGQALVTDGSGGVTFQDVAATLTVDATDGSGTTADVALLTDDLQFTGGEGLDISVAKVSTDVTVTIAGEDATTSNKGIASFSSNDFAVSSGAVTIKALGVSTAQLAADAVTGAKIADDAVDSEHLVDGSVDNVHLAGSIANNKLANSTIAIGDDTIALGASALTDINGLTSLDVDFLTLDGNEITSTNTNGNISLNPNGSGVVDVNNSRISNVTDPTQAQDAATKAYVDAVKQALDIKDSVHVATTANITLSGTQTIDGIAVEAGDRVLVKNQSTGADNGIYVAAAGAWSRAADANTSSEVTPGMFVFVEEGTTNGDNGFVLTTDAPITLDTTSLTFTQFSGAGQIIAGDALSKSGNTLNVNDDNVTLEVNTDALRIKGISATAAGDILLGAATNGGYTRHVKPSSTATAYTYILSMDTSGNARWADVLDGGTF